LTDSLKKIVSESVVSYVLTSDGWDGMTQEVDVSNDYTVTENTRADIRLDSNSYNQLVRDGCCGIYIQTNENDDNKLIAHAISNAPTDDVVIQITLREVK
jgi:hypothetical protein